MPRIGILFLCSVFSTVYVISLKKTNIFYCFHYIYILLECLLLCIQKTSEQIGPQFYVGPHMPLELAYGCSELQKTLNMF